MRLLLATQTLETTKSVGDARRMIHQYIQLLVALARLCLRGGAKDVAHRDLVKGLCFRAESGFLGLKKWVA